MQIVAVEPILVEVPFRDRVHGVHGITASQRSVLVRVGTESGAEGWGNVDPTPGYSVVSAAQIHATIAAFAPVLLGTDPFNIHTSLARMDSAVTEASEAKAAVEMALVDLKARALGLPVHSLLGGRVKDAVTLNAWIGTVPPAQAAAEALAWCERGFRTAKIKVAGATEEGVARVDAVRNAVGDRLALRVDFNESLSLDEALAFIPRLTPYGLTLVEQPISRHDIAGLARIRRGIGIPLMADESVSSPAALVEIIRREAADLVKVKVMKQGGLLRTLAMVQCAGAAGLGVVLGHGFGLTLSTYAEAAVAAVSAAVIDGCEAVGPLKMAGDVVDEPARLEGGVIRLPDAPGLGATIDPAALKRFRVDSGGNS
ncbi:MAG: mandelate racemase/muconate lactonizing enzyme family protein [Candidatus Rokuibacteriota bacterium]